MVDADQGAFEAHFSRDDPAQLPLHNFVNAQHSVFHFFR
jgi:hypothetical protein